MLSVLFLLVLKVCTHREVSGLQRLAIVTGGTGVLGNAIANALSDSFITLSTFRDITKLTNRDSFHRSIHLDLSKLSKSSASHILEECFSLGSLSPSVDEVVLVHNAAVFLKGDSIKALTDSCQINCLAPALLSEALIRSFDRNITVVNISSGDGELTFLHRKLQAEISAISTLKHWHEYLDSHVQGVEFYRNKGIPIIEYSFGESPMYSFSKAMLNAYTRVLSEEAPDRVRVLSICPGNVLSPMSTEEEKLSGTLTLPTQAAEQILRVINDRCAFPGGRFYRDGMELCW